MFYISHKQNQLLFSIFYSLQLNWHNLWVLEYLDLQDNKIFIFLLPMWKLHKMFYVTRFNLFYFYDNENTAFLWNVKVSNWFKYRKKNIRQKVMLLSFYNASVHQWVYLILLSGGGGTWRGPSLHGLWRSWKDYFPSEARKTHLLTQFRHFCLECRKHWTWKLCG